VFLLQLLRNSDYASLAKILSPKLFSVVSPTSIVAVAKTLQASRSQNTTWDQIQKSHSQHLNARPALSPQDQGHWVLEIFFDQVMNQDHWILDLRSDAFIPDARGQIQWKPAQMFAKPDADFLKNVRELYRGFYLDLPDTFDQAVDHLGLSPARDTLRRHFGVGDQSQVRFNLSTFQKTFTEVLGICQKNGIELDRDFLILGLMLIGMYQNLEQLGCELNVRKVFEGAIG
jgi:hypothetical protein